MVWLLGRRSALAGLVIIRDRVAVHRIVFEPHRSCAFYFVHAIALRTFRGARISYLVGFDDKIARLRPDVKTISRLRIAVVQHFVVAEGIAMAAIQESFI